MVLGENIKRLRKKKGWSQAQLAERIGCHLSNITRIETGKYIPSLETVIKIADLLEVSVDYLINTTNGRRGEIRIEDHTLAEKIRLLNSLDEEERQVIIKVIDAMLTKKKVLHALEEG